MRAYRTLSVAREILVGLFARTTRCVQVEHTEEVPNTGLIVTPTSPNNAVKVDCLPGVRLFSSALEKISPMVAKQ